MLVEQFSLPFREGDVLALFNVAGAPVPWPGKVHGNKLWLEAGWKAPVKSDSHRGKKHSGPSVVCSPAFRRSYPAKAGTTNWSVQV